MAAYGSFAEAYDALTENVDYKSLAEYYDKVISSHGGKRGILLDLACGTGSMSIEMSRLGHDVIGVDLSMDMLSKAKEKKHDGIEYLCQDMTALDMFGTIDNTICVLDSINHLENREAIMACFKSVSLFAQPGGLFVFDVNTVKKHREVLADNTFIYDIDGYFCTWQNYLNEDDSVDICLDIFVEKDGLYSRISEDFTEIALPAEEISEMLIESGFEVLDIYNFETFEKGTEDAEKLLFCARKPELL